MDSYERRVLLEMLGFDLGAADQPWTPFGPAIFGSFQASYRLAATRLTELREALTGVKE